MITDRNSPDAGDAGRRKRTKSRGKAPRGEAAFDYSVDRMQIVPVSLRAAAEERYLNYSLSVITSRALPDVRDGLKPVQRRILYVMDQMNLSPTSKYTKCAKVVGDVMGQYHPHGDSAIYEALVRMAQNFSLRIPLVDGSGNFGSIDGDNAAAMRYTECRMAPMASDILADLASATVPYRPNYDGSRREPVVLPSRVPNLLINGATGIAVGMATNIPTHNPIEVCKALLKLLRDPEIKDYQLVANDAVQGPDFPTGGQIINSKDELREIYRTGQGTVRIRGKTIYQKNKSESVLQIVEVPYGVNKSQLVERIGELVDSGKLPLVSDVRDVSTEDIRVDLLLKKDADPEKVLAYLYRHTPLQSNFNVNMTMLVPTENPTVSRPERLGLKEILWHFLHFRLEVVTARLESELAALNRRLHILEGFALIFDALDEIIRIIRASEGKADAAAKIMKRFPTGKGKEGLDAEQTDAILELKLYRLAKLEINLITDELSEKRKRAAAIAKLLKEKTDDTNSSGRWQIVREEIENIIAAYGKQPASARRTLIEAAEAAVEYNIEDFIVAEDCHVLISTDGWVKRQRQIADPSKSRLREGDEVLTCVAASTRATVGFFSSYGVCYTARAVDLPQSSGYGEPIQKFFKLKDGERIIAAISFDSRFIGNIAEDAKHPDYCPDVHAIAATTNGFAMRFGLSTLAEPSTRSGRKYARVAPGHEVVGVYSITGHETLLAATAECRVIVCPAVEVNYLSGAGKGVLLIRLSKNDRLLGFKPSTGDRDLLLVETNRGARKTISTAKYRVTSRGGRGIELQKNGRLARVINPPPDSPVSFEDA